MRKDIKAKLLATTLKLPVLAVINLILPRILGVSNFGKFEFLNSISLKLLSFFENGTLTGFFVKYSKNPNDINFVYYYFRFIVLSTIIISIFISSAFILGFNFLIWEDNSFVVVLLSFLFAAEIFLINFISRVYESNNLTHKSEFLKLISQIFLCTFLAISFYYLSEIKLVWLYVIYISLNLFLIIYLGSSNINFFSKNLFKINGTYYTEYLYKYSSPLLVYFIISTVSEIFTRWYLQKIGGDTEQAFYGLSLKIITILTLILASVIPILTREFSKSGESVLTNKLYSKSFINLLFLSISLSTIMSTNSDFIIKIFGGSSFSLASPVLKLVAFTPTFQILNQLNGSLLYSKGKTKSYSKVGIVLSLILVISTIFFCGNLFDIGMNMGAIGLGFAYLLNNILRTIILTILIILSFKTSISKFAFKIFYTLLIGTLPLLLIKFLFSESDLIIIFVQIIVFLIILKYLMSNLFKEISHGIKGIFIR